MTLEARLHASAVLRMNCEDSDMAILAMGTWGATETCPATPGRYADNLVLQILETR